MNNKFYRKVYLKIIPVFLALIISSCGMWNDFTTYFNRFYNATELYNTAYDDLMKSKEQLFQFKFEQVPKNAEDNFEKVIEKCSKILQFNKESSYFDDALLLTGKSLYYQNNHLKAQRKFQELLGRNHEELGIHAELWIGKTNLQLRNFDLGLQQLEKVKQKALNLEEEEIVIDALNTQISFFLYRENFEEAVLKCEELIQISSSDELNAEVTYEIGIIYKELGQIKKAADAFAKVTDYSPTFEIEFNSLIEEARLKRELKQNSESLELLEELYDEDKYVDFLDQIELEMGMNYYDLSDYEQALEKFTIVDTTYKTTESTGIAVFMKGKILENVLKDYDSAQVFYSKVIKTKAPEEYRLEARNKDKLLQDYLKIRYELDDFLKQYLYSVDSMAFVQDSIDYEEWKYQDSVRTAELNKDNSQTSEGAGTASRRGATTPAASTSSNIKKKKLPPKKPTLSSDSLKTLCAKSKFEMGNLFFAELNVTDSAKYYYNEVLRDYPDSLYTAPQLFSLGSFYSSIEQKELADSLFKIVYEDFRGQEVANEAAKRLGLEAVFEESNPAADSFLVAEKEMLDSNYTEAINILYRIANNYPESDYAPKALYTVGWMLENSLEMRDSAVAVYDSLTAKYNTTKYAKDVTAKVKAYKDWKKEIAAREKAIQDSIKTANMPQDSLKKVMPELPDSVNAVSDSLNTFDLGEGDSTVVIPKLENADSTSIAPKSENIDSLRATKKENPEALSEEEEMFRKAVEQKKETPKKRPKIEK